MNFVPSSLGGKEFFTTKTESHQGHQEYLKYLAVAMRQNEISRVISIEGFRIPPGYETQLENDEDVRPRGEGVRFKQAPPAIKV